MRWLVALILLLAPLPAHALININTADLATLDTLPGIGPTLAQRIIDYRTTNGPFATIEDIINVNGIGPSTFDNFKHLITVGEAPGGSSQAQTTSGTDTSTTTTQSTNTQTTATTQQIAPVSSYVAPPDPSVFVDAGEDRVVIVGAHTTYRARAYNKKKEPLDNVRFNWNFGDGGTAEGATVTHHYEYPGKYVVVLSVAKDIESASDRIVVTAEPARLAFRAESDGSVIIENHADRDLDLSSWIIRAFMREFLLPDNSFILAGSSMRVSPKTLGFFAGAEAELAYPNGVLAMKAGDAPTQSAPASAPSPSEFQAVQSSVAPKPASRASVQLSPAAPDEETEAVEVVPESATDVVRPTVAAASASFGMSMWWFAPVALALLTGGAVMAVRRKRQGEWGIVEDTV